MLRPWIWLSATLGVLLADEASACTPDPCADTTAFVGLNRANANLGEEVEIPIDGVIVMQAQWFGDLTPDALLAGLTLTVSHDGSAVEGTVEVVDRPRLTGVLLWRPAELLLPGTTYAVEASFANPDGVPSECAAKLVEVAFEVSTTDGMAEPLAAPKIWTSARYSESPVFDLDSVICCDGAIPYIQEFCGSSEGITWAEGNCVSTTSRARLAVSLGVATILDDATAEQWARTLYQDGVEVQTTLGDSFSRTLTEPACFTIEQFSLATGEVLAAEERCLGDDLMLPLGDLQLDPSMLLADLCETTPYICEVDETAWVPEQCVDWPWPAAQPVAEPESGCGCVSGEPDATHALLGLALFVRRRQRARAS